MGRPYFSRSFTLFHLMVYETVRAVWKKFLRMKFERMKNECLQDEGVDCSSGCTRAFVWDFEGFQVSHRKGLGVDG